MPFYGALALLARPGRDASEAALQRHLAQLDVWAQACPANFAARRELVRAEHARENGRPLDAAEAYARAVTHAAGMALHRSRRWQPSMRRASMRIATISPRTPICAMR